MRGIFVLVPAHSSILLGKVEKGRRSHSARAQIQKIRKHGLAPRCSS